MNELRLAQLTIARGGRTLVRAIEATFAPGTFTAVMGANGAGKSTLLATLAGVLTPPAGTVFLNGLDIARLAPRVRAQRIALVEPTEAALAAMTVDDAIGGARFPYHRWWDWQPTSDDGDAIDDALRATELTPLRTRELGTLSTGERQRVWIALALAQRADVIALDEPTTHLDLRYALETLALLRRLADDGAVVIAVLHALEEAAAFADRVILIGNGGVLADGTPRHAFTADLLHAAYGVRIGVGERNGALIFDRRIDDSIPNVPKDRRDHDDRDGPSTSSG